MRFVLLAALVLLVVVPAVTVLLRRRPIATATPVDHNHLAMARWIERQIRDDMVRCTIPADQQELGEALLIEYFGDADHKRRELP